MSYRLNIAMSTDNVLIPLKHIESICLEDDSENGVVNKLKDDFTLRITTLSGKQYEISMRRQVEMCSEIYSVSQDEEDMKHLGSEFVKKWVHLITN